MNTIKASVLSLIILITQDINAAHSRIPLESISDATQPYTTQIQFKDIQPIVQCNSFLGITISPNQINSNVNYPWKVELGIRCKF